MDQQIGNADDRICRIFSDNHRYACSVCFTYNAMQRHRSGDPLVLFDAAIIVRIKQRNAVHFKQRVLLEVQTR